MTQPDGEIRLIVERTTEIYQKNALAQYILEQGVCHGTVFNSNHEVYFLSSCVLIYNNAIISKPLLVGIPLSPSL